MNLIEKIQAIKHNLLSQLAQAQRVLQVQGELIKMLQDENDALHIENGNLRARCQEFESGVRV